MSKDKKQAGRLTMPKWKSKLSMAMINHLHQNDIETLKGFKAVLSWQNESRKRSGLEPCYTCRRIAFLLKLHVETRDRDRGKKSGAHEELYI